MSKTSIASALAALSLVAAPVAHAADFGGDFELPQRWNDDYKPETRCGTPGKTGTYVTASRRWFKQTDAASVANLNSESIGAVPCLVDTLTLAHNGPENARDHHAEEHLHR